MERADEVLSGGHVDGGLAADRRIDLADERRRHGHPGDTAEIGRRSKTGDVGSRATAERDDRPGRRPRAPPQMLEHGTCLGGLALRHLVRGEEALAERDLRPDAIDAGDVAVGHELDEAVTGTSESRRSIAPSCTWIPAAARTTPSASRARAVGNGVVVGVTLGMERPEPLRIGGERTPASLDPAPRLVDLDIQQHREGPLTEPFAGPRRSHRAAAELEHEGLATARARRGGVLLERAKLGLAAGREDLLDRRPRPLLDRRCRG